jgi:alanyl-tRNA synthetase
MRNHSATHLLHEALRKVLGNHVKQAGSLVAPDYLRFDFNHFEKVSTEDLKKIEEIVNEKIFENIDVATKITPIDETRKNSNIKMFFGDKYGDIVRVVIMDESYSMEFCGGTHVKNTSEIGMLKILSESSIAAGVRRIEAITGKAIERYIEELQAKLEVEKHNNAKLLDKIKHLEKEIAGAKVVDIGKSYSEWIEGAELIGGIRIVAKEVQAESLDQLRTLGENLRNEFGKNGIGLLATVLNEKVQLVCVVTDDLTKRMPAGKIVGAAAKELGGGGGGKPHLATAGGKDIAKLPELLKQFSKIIMEIN